MASSSACAVGSLRRTVSLWASATTVPSRTITAPTGTSSMAAARSAIASAAAIPAWSSGTRRLRRPRDPPEGEARAVGGAIHADHVTFVVLALEHGQRQGILQQALYGSLQRPRPVHGIVSFGHQQTARARRQLQRQLAIGQQRSDARDLQVEDMVDLVAPQRAEQ